VHYATNQRNIIEDVARGGRRRRQVRVDSFFFGFVKFEFLMCVTCIIKTIIICHTHTHLLTNEFVMFAHIHNIARQKPIILETANSE
jgi:hypothetical protein